MPAGATYSTIATTTLGSNATDYTFSSISGTYTDLYLVCSNLTNTSAQTMYARVNGDTGTNYSFTVLNGSGASASSYRSSSSSQGMQLGLGLVGLSTTNPAQFNVSFLNYSNTTTFKTTISRSGLASGETEASVSLWRSTAAITSITVRPSGGSLQTGTVLTLYGITAA
jgi:phage-related tail fiber protein